MPAPRLCLHRFRSEWLLALVASREFPTNLNGERRKLFRRRDGFVYIDFGPNGLWRWSQATNFLQISTVNPENVEAGADGFVYIDFGVNGFWRWSQAASFLQISTANVEDFSIG